MLSIDEKRVYGDRQGSITVYVASEIGLLEVAISGDTVGEFGLCQRCVARDVAAGSGTVVVATDDDVLVAIRNPSNGPDSENGIGAFEPTGHGEAVAVGIDDGTVLAAAPDGTVSRLTLEGETADVDEDREWERLEFEADRPTPSTVSAIDGPLAGTERGVFRRVGDRLTYAGLEDVRDVSATATPIAATGDGLYVLGNGWMCCVEGEFSVVSAARTRAHAVSNGGLYGCRFEDGRPTATDWSLVTDEPVPGVSSDSIRDLGYGEGTYAVTDDGTMLVGTDLGWRSQAVGVPGVSSLAVVWA
ncbi:hypothetical protein OB919_06990 [Halobacteria archaeon AArc-curdl1]|uniref:HVO-0234-like beta-propeller domain-containing protein n=1 Tax=Natronosalvus hydrolyticus TaxID=2979988 RepID=A0AAP2Z6R0_9EURY|nr:hypothetical protein [Halobacteria archaeon AArc-curdl1]